MLDSPRKPIAEAAITTAAEARDFVLTAPREQLINDIMHKYNCAGAGVDNTGDVWVADPYQAGRWLDRDELVALVEWIKPR